jgi:hypothetical protein
MRRSSWVVVAAILAGFLIGDTLYWRAMVRGLEAGFQDWVVQRRAAGWTVVAGPTSAGGWPLDATLRVPEIDISAGGADIPGGVALRSGPVVLRLRLLHPADLSIRLRGTQHVRFDQGPFFSVDAERLAGQLSLAGPSPPGRIDVRVKSLRAGRVGATDAADALTVGLLRARVDLAPAAGQGEPLASFSVATEAIALPASVRWPLGRIISSLALEGDVQGPTPAAGGITAMASAWRDAGGSLKVRHLALGWGPLGLSGTATLALDDELQPMGTGTSHLVGYAAALDALAAQGTISRSAATAANAVLSLLANTPGEGEPSEVDVPLTLQYRTLSMRQVPLVRLPELDWPAP